MLRYILSIKRANRHLDPLPMDFGCMYYLYPSENECIRGFRSTGLRKKLVAKIRSMVARPENLDAYKNDDLF